MSVDMRIGEGLEVDDGVVIGYASERTTARSLVLGSGARLRSGTVIYEGSRIGARFETGHNVIVREACVIGDDVCIWSNSIIDYECLIGARVKVHANCYVAQFSELRDGVFLAPGVTLANDLYPGSEASASVMSGPLIEDGAQIGANATVLPYVTVGRGAIIGAGAVVSRDIPAGTVAYGCPAVPRRRVDELRDIDQRIEPTESAVRRFRLRKDTARPGRAEPGGNLGV